MNSSATTGRLEWIDWMKAIGIFLIVYGHLFSIGHWYVYTFSVPLFFAISGFLCKRESDKAVFWRKLWYNLVVPMLLISLICQGIFLIYALRDNTFEWGTLWQWPLKVAVGMNGGGVGTLWFVYTLIVLKIFLQFVPRGRVVQAALFITFPLMAVAINHYHPEVAKKSIALLNVCVAYPCFMLGFWARRWKELLSRPGSTRQWCAVALISTAVLLVTTKLNHGVWMYICGYGENFLLFLIGGTAGTALIFSLAKLLRAFTPPRLLKYLKEPYLFSASTCLCCPISACSRQKPAPGTWPSQPQRCSCSIPSYFSANGTFHS